MIRLILFSPDSKLQRLIAPAEDTFRLELYYSTNVLTITAPSLAGRPEDIRPLAEDFRRRYAELFQKPVLHLAPAAVTLLGHYDWPGNVRDLENAIQSVITHSDGDTIHPADLAERLHKSSPAADRQHLRAGSFERPVQEYNLKIAQQAVEECNGSKPLAAVSLNISRAYLHRLIRQAENESNHAA